MLKKPTSAEKTKLFRGFLIHQNNMRQLELMKKRQPENTDKLLKQFEPVINQYTTFCIKASRVKIQDNDLVPLDKAKRELNGQPSLAAFGFLSQLKKKNSKEINKHVQFALGTKE